MLRKSVDDRMTILPSEAEKPNTKSRAMCDKGQLGTEEAVTDLLVSGKLAHLPWYLN